MLKRLCIGIVLMFTAICLCLLSFFLTKIITENVTNKINIIETQILENDTDEAIDSAQSLIENWEKQYKVLSSYISHEDLERTEVAIYSVEKYLYLKDYAAALIICEDIRICTEHLLNSEKPSFWNIF